MAHSPLPQQEDAEAADAFGAPTEKTDICRSKLELWHNGHSARREPYTIASKRFLQSLQIYSKMGIALRAGKTPANLVLYHIVAQM